VYVGTFDADWRTDFEYAVTFDVRLVADGSSDAAYALLDDLASQARIAVTGPDDCYPGPIRWDPLDVDGAQTLPAYTLSATVVIAAATWCATAAPSAVTVPPVPIGVP
jgi:hypothetical protein